ARAAPDLYARSPGCGAQGFVEADTIEVPGIAARRKHKVMCVDAVASPRGPGTDALDRSAAQDVVPAAKSVEELRGTRRKRLPDPPVRREGGLGDQDFQTGR